MSIVTVPGGQVELREKPNVGGRELLQESGFDLINLLRENMGDNADLEALQSLSDIKDLPPEMFTGSTIRAFQKLNRAGVIAFVKSWSLPLPLPTPDNIDEMETDLYDKLAEAVAPLIVVGMFGESFANPGPKADPGEAAASPTGPSPASPGGSTAAPVPSTDPTIEPSDSGVSSPTVDRSVV